MGRHLYQNTWKEEATGKPNDLLNHSHNLQNHAYDLLNCTCDLLNGSHNLANCQNHV